MSTSVEYPNFRPASGLKSGGIGLFFLNKTFYFCFLLLGHHPCVGQETASPEPAAEKPASAVAPANDDQDHRMFGVLPNFKTINNPDQQYTPISSGEKFKLVLHYFDPFTYVSTGIQAGVEQWSNGKKEYGQGSLGYAKRYGADFTDAFTNEVFVVGVFPSLLHEDPRYFRLGQGSGLHRMGYALSRIVVGRSDSGTKRFNSSEFLGNFVSGSISQAYYPQSERGFGGIMTRMGVQIGFDSLFNVLKEFYPDIRRHLHRDKDTNATGLNPSGQTAH